MNWQLSDLLNLDSLTPHLTGKGLDPARAEPLARLLRRAGSRLLELGAAATGEAIALFVPGRIEVLGKHTDYGGGRSLVAATERGLCLVAVPRTDAYMRILDAVYDDTADFTISPELAPISGHWVNYPMTVARRLRRDFAGPLRGADVALASNLPLAAGISSSSAMIVGFYLLLARLNGLDDRTEFRENISSLEDLAGFLGCIENGRDFGALRGDLGVGTRGGSEDHTAILCARPGELVQYSYAPVKFEGALDVPRGYCFAVSYCGISAAKTGEAREKYNRASRLMEIVAELWRRHSGTTDAHVGAVLARANHTVEKMRHILASHPHAQASPKQLLDRFDHFVAENQQILPNAVHALKERDVPRFGELADRSQALAERLLGNQVPETVALARSARQLGAAASSAFGAGFGGSVWALVRNEEAPSFLDEWSARYRELFPQAHRRAVFFVTGAGPSAFVLGPQAVTASA